MQVMMMPDYRADNPYQTLLANELALAGLSVQFPQGYRRVFPLRRALQQSDSPFDVLHLHWTNPYLKGRNYWMRSIYSIKLLIDIWLVKLLGVRVVWTIHNLVSHESQFSRLELWVHRRLAKYCDRIIVHYKDAKAEVATLYKVKEWKISVIPHGHYREAYSPSIDKLAAREQLGLSVNDTVYLSFGMLRPYKGIENLLQTWQSEQLYNQAATLMIAGKPMNATYGQSIADMVYRSSKVVLHDRYIDDADVAVYFSAADVVVLPFNNVSTSGSLLLAMSYSKPIVTPSLGSVKETINDADWLLYDANSEQGLLHALEASLETDLQALSKIVRRVCDRMGWDAIAQATFKLYLSTTNHVA